MQINEDDGIFREKQQHWREESTPSTFHRRQSRKTFKRKSLRSKCNLCVCNLMLQSFGFLSPAIHLPICSMRWFVRWLVNSPMWERAPSTPHNIQIHTYMMLIILIVVHHSSTACICVLIKYLQYTAFAVGGIFQPPRKSTFPLHWYTHNYGARGILHCTQYTLLCIICIRPCSK